MVKEKKDTKPQGTWILDFQPLELWEISFCCLSCPVYGILLHQLLILSLQKRIPLWNGILKHMAKVGQITEIKER